jgi:hypothetical protein
MSPVGCPNLDELGTGRPHYLRNAELAADFDELAPADDYLFPRTQRRETHQHGRRVVVHDNAGLGPGQRCQQFRSV